MRLNLLERKENAHKDSIWAAKWVTEPGAQGEDVKLITGSVDETCKAWREVGSPARLVLSEIAAVSERSAHRSRQPDLTLHPLALFYRVANRQLQSVEGLERRENLQQF